MRLKRVPAAFQPSQRPCQREWPKTDIRLSVVIPYFRKLREFSRVMPMNAPFLQRKGVEVILCLDEPTEEREVVSVVKEHPGVQTTVMVNDADHEWRAPTKSINVGIRRARGDLVLVVSPETAFRGDVPGKVIRACDTVPGGTVIGRVFFSTFRGDGMSNGGLYGVMCAPRSVLHAVRGYDESFTGWGGDDIDLRRRVQMAGYTLYSCEDVQVTHLSEKIRRGMRDGRTVDEEQLRRSLRPATPFANPDGWGEAFSRVAVETTL